MPLVTFEDGSTASYVRNTYQLNYKGAVYVNRDPEEPVDFAHNAKARMGADHTIQILSGGQTHCELVPAKTIEIPMEGGEKAVFVEGASFVEYAQTMYYGQAPMVHFSASDSKGRIMADGCLEIRTELGRHCQICVLKKEKKIKKPKRKADQEENPEPKSQGKTKRRV